MFWKAFIRTMPHMFLEKNWEELSKLTKAEILKENLQDVRIIHNNNWQQEIRDLLEVA